MSRVGVGGPRADGKPHTWRAEWIEGVERERCARCGVCAHWPGGRLACPGVLMAGDGVGRVRTDGEKRARRERRAVSA